MTIWNIHKKVSYSIFFWSFEIWDWSRSSTFHTYKYTVREIIYDSLLLGAGKVSQKLLYHKLYVYMHKTIRLLGAVSCIFVWFTNLSSFIWPEKRNNKTASQAQKILHFLKDLTGSCRKWWGEWSGNSTNFISFMWPTLILFVNDLYEAKKLI